MSAFTEKGGDGSLRGGPQGGVPDRSDLPLNNDWDECKDTVHGSLRGGSRAGTIGDFTKGRGAGRIFDLTYPIPAFNFASNGAPGTSISRQGFALGNLGGLGQDPGVSTTAYYRGRVAYRFTAATGRAAIMMPFFKPNNLNEGPQESGDFHCWRVKLIVAYSAIGAGDLGMWLVHAGDTSFRSGTGPGMSIAPVGANAVKFLARQAVSLFYNVDDSIVYDLDTADYNSYELRFISGSDFLPAFVRVLINGYEVARYEYDEGLPVGPYQVLIGSALGGECYIPMCGFNMAAARDEASLL
jgi:hypothetical protein